MMLGICGSSRIINIAVLTSRSAMARDFVVGDSMAIYEFAAALACSCMKCVHVRSASARNPRPRAKW